MAVSWSGGKDVALALHYVLRSGEFEIENLHCVIGEATRRVGLHGVRESLIQQQGEAIGVPLVKSYLGNESSNRAYEELMGEAYASFRERGITHILFGDIFLEDLKAYREDLLRRSGLTPVFPLWKRSSEWCANAAIIEGVRAIVCAANEACFSRGLLGRNVDNHFLQALPSGLDPAGENGEFHTFVFDAPYFRHPIGFSLGEITSQSYECKTMNDDGTADIHFYFQDLLSSIKDLNASNIS